MQQIDDLRETVQDLATPSEMRLLGLEPKTYGLKVLRVLYATRQAAIEVP